MPVYLTTPWMERAAAAVNDDTVLGDNLRKADATSGVTVVYVITGCPTTLGDANGVGGQITYSVHLSKDVGAVFTAPAATTEAGGEDVVVLTLDYETSVAIHRGELDPADAMSAAKVQVKGAAGLLLPYQDAFARVPDALETLREETTY